MQGAPKRKRKANTRAHPDKAHSIKHIEREEKKEKTRRTVSVLCSS